MPTRLKRLLTDADSEQLQLEKLTESILPNLDSDIRRQVQAVPTDDAATAEEKWRRALTEAVAASGAVESDPANSGAVVSSVSELALLDPTIYQNATTLGYFAAYDGGGSTYRWVSDVSGANNGAKIVSSRYGAWVNTSTIINVAQWGVVPGNTATCGARINEAIEYAGSLSTPPRVMIPPGEYRLETSIVVRKSNIHIDLFGTLKNKDTLPYCVMYIGNASSTVLSSSNTVQSVGPTIDATSGKVLTYAVKNVVIDGHGVGVIDQNSQSLASWESYFASPGYAPQYGSYHAFFAYGVENFTAKGLTVKNSVIWAVDVECCNHFELAFLKVYTGFANGRMRQGNKAYLATQDGIHAHDSKNGFIHNCIAESGDDAIAVTAARTSDAGNIVVSDNFALTKMFAYELDGTLNNRSQAGHYALSCFIIAQKSFTALSSVTFANNIIDGSNYVDQAGNVQAGAGMFCVYDSYYSGTDGQYHTAVPKDIKFLGNQFLNLTSAGNTSTVGGAMSYCWQIDGGDNVEFVGNTFDNIMRCGRIGIASTKNGTVTFRSNKFSNFKVFTDASLLAGATSAILWFSKGTRLIVSGNTFENNEIIPVLVGAFGSTTYDLFEEVIFNNNTCYSNNMRWASSAQTSSDYSAILNVNSAKYIEFNNNTIVTNYGSAFVGRAIRSLIADGNRIKNLGNSANTQAGEAFYIGSYNNNSPTYTDIRNNNVSDIDGRFLTVYTPGQLFLVNNVINNPCRYRDASYMMYIYVGSGASSLSDPAYTSFGGHMTGNTTYRSSAQSLFYLDSSVATNGVPAYSGNKFAYSFGQNNFGSNYTNPSITAAAAGLVDASGKGTAGKIVKFTSTTGLGDSILTESGSIVTATGGLNVTDSYQVNGAYVVSWAPSYLNAIFGTRPSGWATITGSQNTGTGTQALYALTTGFNNTAGGYRSLYGVTSGYNNTAAGSQALLSLTTGAENTAVGSLALTTNVNGIHNTALGAQSLRSSTSGSSNTCVGSLSGYSSTTGALNTAIGYLALNALTTGDSNFAGGVSALRYCTTGAENVAVGRDALSTFVLGSRNVAIGNGALTALATGTNSNNIAIGYYSGHYLTTGSQNIIIGYYSEAASSTGSNQLTIGNLIYGTGLDGIANTISSGNIGIGVKAPACKLEVNGAIKGTYLRFGSVTPEGNETAPVGALYSQTAGGAGTTLYVKESGTGNTGWVAMKTYTGGTGTNIYNTDGTLTANRTVSGGSTYSLTINNVTSLSMTSTAGATLQGTTTATVQSGSGLLTLTSTTGNVDLNAAAAGAQVSISAKGELRIKTPAVNAATAAVNQVLSLSNATTGAVEFVTIPSSVNLYNTNGTLTGNRTVTGGNFSLSITGVSTLDLTSTTSTTLTSARTNFVHGASSLYLDSTTSSGSTTTDYILGVNPATGQIRYTATTVASLGGGGSGGIMGSGTLNQIPRFTGATTIGNSIMDQTTSSLISIAGSVSISSSASEGFKIGSDFALSRYSTNLAVGDRPSGWTSLSGAANNTLCGVLAGNSLSTSVDNTAVGYGALYSLTTGSGSNTAVGVRAMKDAQTAENGTAVGWQAMWSCTSGANNTAVGVGALLQETTGSKNTVVGANALCQTGGRTYALEQNVAFGYSAGSAQQSGTANVIIGYSSQVPDKNGSYQLSIGNLIYGTGLTGTGDYVSSGNIGIGVTNPSTKLQVAGTVKATEFNLGNLTITSGTGAPSSSPPVGSIYLDTSGGSTTTLYVMTSSGWVAK